jgi:hypothetical protein
VYPTEDWLAVPYGTSFLPTAWGSLLLFIISLWRKQEEENRREEQ